MVSIGNEWSPACNESTRIIWSSTIGMHHGWSNSVATMIIPTAGHAYNYSPISIYIIKIHLAILQWFKQQFMWLGLDESPSNQVAGMGHIMQVRSRKHPSTNTCCLGIQESYAIVIACNCLFGLGQLEKLVLQLDQTLASSTRFLAYGLLDFATSAHTHVGKL